MRFLPTLSFLVAMPALAGNPWNIDLPESRLAFEATQQGGQFEGEFEQFSADMQFSAEQLGDSHFNVRIDVTSIQTGSSQRDRELPKQDWFAMDEFTEARFETTEIREATDNVNYAYAAEGTLTIKGHSEPVVLPFDWQISDSGQARMQGELVIDRTTFGIGEGDWEDPSAVGHDVRVLVDVQLNPAD
ncbi:MAG: YceI family protein [Gammaproteobacteria bacterium]|nr:YceI family protein [Gammaproteobacteria bacterium]